MNQEQQTIEDYRLKLLLEQRLAVKMRKIFSDISDEAKAYYISRGEVLPIDHYDLEIQATLQAHYRVVASKFKNRLRAHIEKMAIWQFDTKALEDEIDAAIGLYLRTRAKTQTDFIRQTNLKELTEAFNKTVISSIVSGVFLSREKIAEEGAIAFERTAMARAATIGLTETQNMAEATKDIEAFGILDEKIIAGGVVLSPDKITKTWSAILDKATREWHMEADDQTVPQNQPFIVMNEQLMFPGDTSLGATPKNFMNCRCNTYRAIELAGLPSFVVHPENRAPSNRLNAGKSFHRCECGLRKAA